jgi:leucine dehydrogenase
MSLTFERLNIPTHERVHRFADDGVMGFIAIHSTVLGPALGGARLFPYVREADALADALRLSEGMTYKNALAELDAGGGKAALFATQPDVDRQKMFAALGRAVDLLQGQYVTAEDLGTCVNDMQTVREHSRFVVGLPSRPGTAGGDPSRWTALGVFEAMKAAARFRFGNGLESLTVAVQGLGAVGMALCELLHAERARIIAADANASRVEIAVERFGVEAVGPTSIHVAAADVFAPCALGGVLSSESIPELRAKIVLGAANNQLLRPEQDAAGLDRRGIVYVPDYVVNAGGVINAFGEYRGCSVDEVALDVRRIGARTTALLNSARCGGVTPWSAAQLQAKQLLNRPHFDAV